jgi:replicative superfamily II helicase
MEDRRLMEEIFSAGLLALLSSTSMGVNLPAHMVVIKSTQQMVAGAL